MSPQKSPNRQKSRKQLTDGVYYRRFDCNLKGFPADIHDVHRNLEKLKSAARDRYKAKK